MEELARRAVACKHWRWMPGMLTDDGVRVLECENTSVWAEPDLTDPATLGCLIHIVLSGSKVVLVKDGNPLRVESLVEALEELDTLSVT